MVLQKDKHCIVHAYGIVRVSCCLCSERRCGAKQGLWVMEVRDVTTVVDPLPLALISDL